MPWYLCVSDQLRNIILFDAVTIGLLVAGKISVLRAVLYILAQVRPLLINPCADIPTRMLQSSLQFATHALK